MQKPQEKLLRFFEKGRLLVYPRGRVILHSEDNPSGIYFIKKGYVKDTSVSKEGQEFTLFIFKPKDVFPYRWALGDLPLEHTYSAMTDCLVLRSEREKFVSFVKENPDVLFLITQNLLVRIRGVLQRLEQMAFGNARKKVASIFVILGERFGEREDGKIKIDVALSHKDIAELVGITRETASIEIKRLENERIIDRTGKKYTILRNKKLLQESHLF